MLKLSTFSSLTRLRIDGPWELSNNYRNWNLCFPNVTTLEIARPIAPDPPLLLFRFIKCPKLEHLSCDLYNGWQGIDNVVVRDVTYALAEELNR